MENILSKVNANGLEITLTEDKLFIKTKSSNETFATRAINGIGVIDLVDEYNQELAEYHRIRDLNAGSIVAMGFGVVLVIVSQAANGGTIELMIGILIILFGLLRRKKSKELPKLLSAVRIMISGATRDFKFDKTGELSKDIADFFAKIESTFTSFHYNSK